MPVQEKASAQKKKETPRPQVEPVDAGVQSEVAAETPDLAKELSQQLAAQPAASPPPASAPHPAPPLNPRQVMHLQRQVGNQAVQRMLAVPSRRARIQREPIKGEHEAAKKEAEASQEKSKASVEGDAHMFQGHLMSADSAALEKILKVVIADKGFKGAVNFVMNYNFRGGLSREELDLRNKISPLLQSKLDELVQRGRDFINNQFSGAAMGNLEKILNDSQKVVDGEAQKYGLNPEKETLAESTNTTDMVNAAKDLLSRNKRIEDLNKKRESYEQKVYGYKDTGRDRGFSPPPQEVIDTKITDPAAHKQVCDEIKQAQKEYDQARSVAEGKYPVLASFRPPQGLDQLKSVAEGSKEKRDEIVAEQIEEKRKNITEIRGVVRDGKFIWGQESLMYATKKTLGVQPGSVEDKAVEQKVAEVEHSALMRKLGLALVGLIAGALAAIPTGGGSLVAAGAAAAGAGAAAAAGAISIYEGIREYQVQKAAGGTNFDKAKAISQEDPSLFWLALDIVGSIMDIGGAAAAFTKAARAVRAVEKAEKLEDMARSAYRGSGLGGIMSEEEFVQHFLRNMPADFATTAKARTGLVASLKDGTHPNMKALVSGDGAALTDLAKSYGKWEVLINELNAGTPEMKQIAARLSAYRETEVVGKIKELVGGDLLPGASKQGTSDLDFNLVSGDGMGAGEKLLKAETYMVNKFGPGWDEMWRVNFYTDLKSRLVLTEEALSGMSEAKKAKTLLKHSKDAAKYDLARRLQNARGNAAEIANIENEAKALELDVNEIRNLANTGEDAGKLERNKLLLQADALEAELKVAKGERAAELRAQISELSMKANFYTKEAVTSQGSAAGLLVAQGGKVPKGLQAAEAIAEWCTMFEHIVAEQGSLVQSLQRYETWKYIARIQEVANGADLASDMRARLSALFGRAEHIAAKGRELGTKAIMTEAPLREDVLNTLVRDAQEFTSTMRKLSSDMRVAEIKKLKEAAGE